jgi:Rrf2 family protein
MFSQTVEYALRAMVVLARQPDVPRTAQSIASHSQVPADYLIKVMGSLSRVGLVQAQRGRNGGFALARDPEAIRILDVVNAVDPLKRIRRCPLGLEEHRRSLCALHRKMDDAIEHVETVFATTTLADVLKPANRARMPLGGLCHVQAAT